MHGKWERVMGDKSAAHAQRRQSFILTIWVEPDPGAGAPQWRFSLENALTAERRGFRTLPELLRYLEQLTTA